ncbi:MAG TPA: hypothetical protein VNX26_16760 [Candidatus Acidoferrum sp.]|jgi:hypothetical protein|nr:hypothetical protein [Candidatus Acidoferrum sp.]
MHSVRVLGLLLAIALADVSWAQHGKPLIMDSFTNGVYTFHMGEVVVKARCAYAEVVGSDLAKPVVKKCSDRHGVLEVPGDSVLAFQWGDQPTKGTTRTNASYETFPNGDLDVSDLSSWDCIDGLPQCSHYRIVIYHFKVLDMKQQAKSGK